MAEEQAEHTPLIDPNVIPSAAQAPAEGAAPTVKRKPTAAELGPGQYCWGTGRRKASVARVRLRPGAGNISINGKGVDDFFSVAQDRNAVWSPLKASNCEGRFDVFVNVKGGGTTGQSGAVMLGLARALVIADPDTFGTLRDGGYLTRDARMVERKKYGQKGARKRFQFSKR